MGWQNNIFSQSSKSQVQLIAMDRSTEPILITGPGDLPVPELIETLGEEAAFKFIQTVTEAFAERDTQPRLSTRYPRRSEPFTEPTLIPAPPGLSEEEILKNFILGRPLDYKKEST
jgi:hypothetical protein